MNTQNTHADAPPVMPSGNLTPAQQQALRDLEHAMTLDAEDCQRKAPAVLEDARASLMLDACSTAGNGQTGLTLWAALVLRVPLVDDTGCTTMYTDGDRICYDARFVVGMPLHVVKAVLVHEAVHVAYGHAALLAELQRKETHWLPARLAEVFNVCADYMVNAILDAGGYRLPMWALRHAFYGARDLLETLRIARGQLPRQQQPQQDDSSGTGSGTGTGDTEDDSSSTDGSAGAGTGDDDSADADDSTDGAGAAPDGTEDDSADKQGTGTGSADDSAEDAADGQNGQQQQPTLADMADMAGGVRPRTASQPATQGTFDLDTALHESIMFASGAGDLPSALRESIEARLKPVTPWQALVRRWLRKRLPAQTSYTRQNKRKPLLAGKKRKPRKVLLAIDVSSSVRHDLAARFMSEVDALLHTLNTEVHVMYVDTQCLHMERLQPRQRLKYRRVSGGGTSYQPVWDQMRKEKYSACIYFTDLQVWRTDHWHSKPPCDVAYAVYEQPSSYYMDMVDTRHASVLPLWHTLK